MSWFGVLSRLQSQQILPALLLLWGQPTLAAGDDPPSPLLMWLFNLPNAALVLLIMAVSVLIGLLAWFVMARFSGRGTGSSAQGAVKAAAVGALLGAMLSWLMADSWQSYMIGRLIAMPSTAAGLGGVSDTSPQRLLGDPDEEGRSLPPQVSKKVLAGRGRHATVNFAAIEAPSIELNLFEDETLVARRTRVDRNVQGGEIWVGQINNSTTEGGGEVVLVAKGATLMGTVEMADGRSFEIVYVKGNTHAVRQIDPNRTPPEYEPKELAHPSEADMSADVLAGTDGATATAGEVSSTGQVIDLMVAYTPKARTNAGGVSGIETRIMNAVARANQAYLNSQINMQLNLVKMVETNYVETGDMSVTLSKFRGTTDGAMDEIHALRNEVAADQVALISADSNYCGIASVMTTVSTAFASSAFAVVHDDSVYNCLGSNNTLAHELGHNQGNMHDADSSSFAGAFPDSYGYRVCGVFRDIMAYSCQGEIRIPYFSNPNILYAGQPIGIAGSADTARSMGITAPTVASFRTSTATATAPAAPTGLSASSPSSTSISLLWTDNATDESGYKVQRSADGATWVEIASLTSNTTGFSDDGLTAGTTYYYRVLAWNSVGNSAYSNTAQAATAAPPPADTLAPTASLTPASGATVKGTVAVLANGQDNVGISKMTLSLDGKVVSTTLNPGATGQINYSWNTKKATVGSHTLSVTVIDTSNLSFTTSSTVNVTR